MSDRKQPTPIDEDVYGSFVDFVEDVHGSTRGHLRTEIENALREYQRSFYDGDDRLARIENDVATIKAMMAEADGDGGETIPDPAASDGSDTRARSDRGLRGPGVEAADDIPESKPAPNQPRAKKAAWIERKVHETRDDTQAFSVPATKNLVDREYGFDQDAKMALVDRVIERLEAVIDPTDGTGQRFVWGQEERALEDDADGADGGAETAADAPDPSTPTEASDAADDSDDDPAAELDLITDDADIVR